MVARCFDAERRVRAHLDLVRRLAERLAGYLAAAGKHASEDHGLEVTDALVEKVKGARRNSL